MLMRWLCYFFGDLMDLIEILISYHHRTNMGGGREASFCLGMYTDRIGSSDFSDRIGLVLELNESILNS